MTPFATTLAPWQVAQLWADLEDAYEGCASHGDTTEVYAYRLLPYDPMLNAAMGLRTPPTDGMYADALRDGAIMARDALVSVARAFEKRRECKVFVIGTPLDAFAADNGFTHRVPVRVQK